MVFDDRRLTTTHASTTVIAQAPLAYLGSDSVSFDLLRICSTTCCRTNPRQVEVTEFGLMWAFVSVNRAIYWLKITAGTQKEVATRRGFNQTRTFSVVV